MKVQWKVVVPSAKIGSWRIQPRINVHDVGISPLWRRKLSPQRQCSSARGAGVVNLRRSARALYDQVRDETLGFLAAEPVRPLRRKLLEAIGKLPLLLGTFEESSDESHVIVGPGRATAMKPVPVGAVPQPRESAFGPIKAHMVCHALTSPYVSGVIRGNCLLLPSQVIRDRARIRTHDAPLFHFEEGHALTRQRSSVEIPEGILVGGAGAFNWYHFIVECLPKALLASRLPQEFSSLPLLVPTECGTVPSFSDALRLFSESRRIIYLDSKQVAHVKRLIVFDDVSLGPFNLTRGSWPMVEDYGQHDDFMNEYFHELRSRLLGNDGEREPKKRFYLARPGLRRNYNQDELMDIAGRFGFAPLELERLTLPEQARHLSEAEAIVGPSGAAWTGLALCSAGVQGISWLPKEYEQFSSYSSLAHLLGHRLHFLTAETEQPLGSSADAYEQSYVVDATQFEDALRQVMGKATLGGAIPHPL